MTLLVSIHDVTPAHADSVDRLWRICTDRAVIPALLVVPNWHGRWPLETHPGFVEWVRGCVAEGAEIALHGERHDEIGLGRGPLDRLRAWGKTDGEAEFLTLDPAAAGRRITRGLDLFRNLGLVPTGFVPPAWLAREGTYQAAAAAGLSFSEDDRTVRLLAAARRIASPVVRWSTRTLARAWGSVAVARGRWLLQRGADFPRIALHPSDLSHAATARSLVRELERWLTVHRPGRYADLYRQAQPA